MSNNRYYFCENQFRSFINAKQLEYSEFVDRRVSDWFLKGVGIISSKFGGKRGEVAAEYLEPTAKILFDFALDKKDKCRQLCKDNNRCYYECYIRVCNKIINQLNRDIQTINKSNLDKNTKLRHISRLTKKIEFFSDKIQEFNKKRLSI